MTNHYFELKYRYCWLLNRLFFWSVWKRALIVKAWKEELDRGLGGIGNIVLVLKDALPGDAFQDCNEPIWVLHPKSHIKQMRACGVSPEERWPLYLNQAVVIP